MKKNFAAMRVKNVYWFNREREALVQMVLVRSHFELNTGKVTHEWAEADGDQKKIILLTDYDPEQPDLLPSFYIKPESFEKDERCKADMLYIMRSEKDICGELLKNRKCRLANSDENGAYVWAFIKGQAVKWYFQKHIHSLIFHYENGVVASVTADGVDVPECYYDVEDVYQYNDWTEVKPNGERVTHEAVYKRLMLSPDQVELADKLQAALEECKAAGMKVYYSLSDFNLKAVNVRHVEYIEYDPIIDEDTEIAYPFEDYRAGRVFSGVCDLNTEGGETKFVIKK